MQHSEQTEIIKKKTPPSDRRGSLLDQLSNRFKARKLNWEAKNGFQGGPSRRGGYQITLWSWMASLIDALILLGMSCLFVIVFAKIVQSSAAKVVHDLSSQHSVVVLFLGIYVLTSWFYMVLLRSFFASSIGEWACDLQLGRPEEQQKSNYILKVILRATLIILTGVITLPAFSLLIGQDIPGKISGLRLFSLK